jgi:alkylhydroperoxidase family enzyme
MGEKKKMSMDQPSGQTALRTHAPEQALVLERLERGAWVAMHAAQRLDLFDLAARAVALQHGLDPLPRPKEFGKSPWTRADAENWRQRTDLVDADRAALALAEQMAFNVASTQADQRTAFFEQLGAEAVAFAQAVYVADLLPRAHAALDALFGSRSRETKDLSNDADLGAAIEDVIRLIPALEAVDPVTTELVRLLGARRHACRVCQSVRSYSAMAAGADDALFDSVESHETADYDPAQKAALAFADGMLASPARFASEDVARLRAHFGDAACVELILDILRNATNKIAVALGGDAPRVESGYEVYDVKPTGEIVYGLTAP